ncbi:MAG: hypothetical protein CMC83_06225 [Flavobacteriaceae bacterium]|nr:hypothetical protein [Flavobacteriaceae bacterium]|tara:strand:- start:306 stop:782 length:477 start_codon:yes stop_codon:yes gene_type:complete
MAMKYKMLSKDQFDELHKEFIKFLSSNLITKEEWTALKSKEPNVAQQHMKKFSDIVWENVLKKVKFLENINLNYMYLFKINIDSISLIGLKVNNTKLDLRYKEGIKWLRENLMSDDVEIFTAEKKIDKDKEQKIFSLIEQGASITKGNLFKYFEELIV